MKDPLLNYFKQHEPRVPDAPGDEWLRIQKRIRRQKRTQQRLLWGLPVASLAVAVFLTVRGFRESEVVLNPDEVSYGEVSESAENTAYSDWMLFAEDVGQSE